MDIVRTEMGWKDDNPYYLLIADDDEGVEVDLGESGWLTRYREWLRRPGLWALVRKATSETILVVQVLPGEQPYYTARHVGVTGSAGGNEIIAYGIGKKAIDGTMTRLWVMPGGMVCGGDDVDTLGVRLVKALGPR